MEPDLGIWIFKSFRGQGYASEAVKLAVTYLFEHSDLDYIVIGIYEHNVISRRLFEKLGFQRAPQLDETEPDAFGEGEIVQIGCANGNC
ncbi:MAG: GNAT family N-acetyltransferase [Anaerolineales bacterium]|nr:GNAT family N-acetyltransferase [Anaerolineales bacterium]